MGENANATGDVEMSNSEMVSDLLTILKEFSNIANLVGDEEFLATVPKAKHRRVKWGPMFNCLKQDIENEMTQELSIMWRFEGMPCKLQLLEKQKEKFAEKNIEKPLWRPPLGDVKAQLRASEAESLRKQRVHLDSLAREYEARVHRLKKVIAAKRGYLKALQMDMQKYQRKNEDLFSLISDKLTDHENLNKMLIPTKQNPEELNWSAAVYKNPDEDNWSDAYSRQCIV